jgi:hypothetical protein
LPAKIGVESCPEAAKKRFAGWIKAHTTLLAKVASRKANALEWASGMKKLEAAQYRSLDSRYERIEKDRTENRCSECNHDLLWKTKR